MIFISSACIKEKNLSKNLNLFNKNNLRNIELSGGTNHNKKTLKILKSFKQKGFDFLIHNYFPIPKLPFMLNLGSDNKLNSKKSLKNCIEAIKLCHKLKAKKFSVHAPFLFDFNFKEAGKKISPSRLYNVKNTIKIFKQNWKILQSYAGKDVKLYVENNVLNKQNYDSFNKQIPLLFTDMSSFEMMRNEVDFVPLIDTGHLKVSCYTLGKNFELELKKLSPHTDFFQISDNNSLFDQNLALKKNSLMYRSLKKLNLKNKTFSIEVYEGLKEITETINSIKSILKK